MKQYSFTADNGKEYKRVSKAAAKKAYECGEEVVLCPCALRPGPPWNPQVTISKNDTTFDSFDRWVHNFEYYNLNGAAETGRYTAFFTRV